MVLINLRIVSNVVFFVGRARAGEDEWATLTLRLDTYARRVGWVDDHATCISDVEKARTTRAEQ